MSSTVVSAGIKYSTKPTILSFKMLSSWWGVGIDKSPSNYKCNKRYSSKCSLKKKKKRPKKRGPLTLTGEVRNNFTEDMTLDLGHEQ